MKFSHEYEATLRQADFPVAWVEVALSYRQLKKCIKKIQTELSSVGLEPTRSTQSRNAMTEEWHSGVTVRILKTGL